jgi:hypothetical protein
VQGGGEGKKRGRTSLKAGLCSDAYNEFDQLHLSTCAAHIHRDDADRTSGLLRGHAAVASSLSAPAARAANLLRRGAISNGVPAPRLARVRTWVRLAGWLG